MSELGRDTNTLHVRALVHIDRGSWTGKMPFSEVNEAVGLPVEDRRLIRELLRYGWVFEEPPGYVNITDSGEAIARAS